MLDWDLNAPLDTDAGTLTDFLQNRGMFWKLVKFKVKPSAQIDNSLNSLGSNYALEIHEPWQNTFS